MSFNRSGYIGRAPGDSAITIAKQYYQPTGVQTDFTFSSGYSPGLVDVYRNGVKLINVLDYAATDGSTISLDSPVGVGSTVQVVAYKAFNLATVKATELDTSVTGTDLTLGGDLTVSDLITTVDINVSGSATVSGTVVAGSFSGDGSALTGLATTETVRADTLTVAGVSTFTGAVDSNATTDSTSSTTGAITAAGGVGIAKDLFVGDAIDVTKDLKVGAAVTITGALSGSTGTFSGAVNVDATTDSTSSSTGALIVDGGLGVAKNVYIGAGLSVAGTLTYEDVTSVDSVGMVTAKSGVNVSGGQLQVGVAYSVGAAGVCTAAGFVGPLTGAVTGNATGLTGTPNISAGTIAGSTGTFTGDLSIADKIIHTGDTNCAIRFPEADTITAETGGTERLRVVGSGVSILANGSDAVRSIRIDGTNGSSENGAFILENDGENAKANFKTSQGDGAPAKRLAITGLGDIEVYGTAAGVSSVTWDASANSLIFNDDSKAVFGTGSDLQIYHSANNWNYITSPTSRNLSINPVTGEAGIQVLANQGTHLFYDGSERLKTTYDGIEMTGFTSTTAGMGVTGGLFEGSFIKAGKLSDNATLGISTANFFYFTTQETTTATPNIVWNDSYSLSNKMAVGDVASVTVVTTAAAGGYAANWTIDGNAVTEEWVGGSAPSAGGSDGLDIYSLTIIKTGTGTGDSGFKVIANVSNAT